MKVLVSAPYMKTVKDKYKKVLSDAGIESDFIDVAQMLKEAELLKIIDQYDGVICGDDQFTAQVIEKGAKRKLKVIAKWGVGIDSIDADAAKKHGVAVRRTPGGFGEAVANMAWGYILMFARSLHTADQAIRQGKWEKYPGMTLEGRTLGIVGLGDIGRKTAVRATGFGMPVLATDIRKVSFPGVKMVSKEDLLKQSDFVVLACDLNSTSFHVISEKELSLMKKTAYLINVARGPLVEQGSAANALKSGKIAGAAFDVFEEEPLTSQNPLWDCPNTIFNAHNGFNADKSVAYVHENTVRELLKVLIPNKEFEPLAR